MSNDPNTPLQTGGAMPPGLEPPKPGKPSKASAEFRDFLLRTAELLRLEPKRVEAAAVVEGDVKPKGKSLFALVSPRLRLGLIAAAVVVVALVTTKAASGPPVLPESVHGVWRTDAAGYATRRFEVTEKNLAFQTDENPNAITRHEITRVKTRTVVEGTMFQVDYLDQPEDKSPLTFEFILTIGDRPTIVFANQRKVVWKRSGPVTGGDD